MRNDVYAGVYRHAKVVTRHHVRGDTQALAMRLLHNRSRKHWIQPAVPRFYRDVLAQMPVVFRVGQEDLHEARLGIAHALPGTVDVRSCLDVVHPFAIDRVFLKKEASNLGRVCVSFGESRKRAHDLNTPFAVLALLADA